MAKHSAHFRTDLNTNKNYNSLPHFCHLFKYYTGENKNVAVLIINDLVLKKRRNKRSLQKTYIEFLLFGEDKMHFLFNHLSFNILDVLFLSFSSHFGLNASISLLSVKISFR